MSVRIVERLPNGLGLRAFAARGSEAARDLHRLIAGYLHCRIWGLSPDQRQALNELFIDLGI
jgi:hypothetical protein